MQDTKLFETILGLQAPWHIARVELNTNEQRVDLWLTHDPTRWPCPECGELLPGFDHAEERIWRHLDTCQFQTHVHAEIPRVQCLTHGVKQARVPWADAQSLHAVDGTARHRSDSAVQHSDRGLSHCPHLVG